MNITVRFLMRGLPPAIVFWALFLLPGGLRAQDGWTQYRIAGRTVAAAYQNWSIPVTTAVRQTGQATVVTLGNPNFTLPGGPELEPLHTGARVLVSDPDPSLDEVVTIQSVQCPQGPDAAGCSLSASFAHLHPAGCVLRSATHGLQEAIDGQAAIGGGIVALTPAWLGSPADLAAVSIPPNVAIQDVRNGQETWYSSGSESTLAAVSLKPGGTIQAEEISASSIGGVVFADAFLPSCSMDIGCAINSAIAALPSVTYAGTVIQAGTVEVAAGVYSFSTTIKKPRYVLLRGQGTRATILHYAGSGTAMVVGDGLFPNGDSFGATGLQDITLIGPNQSQAKAGDSSIGIFLGGDPAMSAPATTIATASRQDQVVTFTTDSPHGLGTGMRVQISGVNDTSFDGTFLIANVLTPTSFRVNQVGPDASSTGGSAGTLPNAAASNWASEETFRNVTVSGFGRGVEYGNNAFSTRWYSSAVYGNWIGIEGGTSVSNSNSTNYFFGVNLIGNPGGGLVQDGSTSDRRLDVYCMACDFEYNNTATATSPISTGAQVSGDLRCFGCHWEAWGGLMYDNHGRSTRVYISGGWASYDATTSTPFRIPEAFNIGGNDGYGSYFAMNGLEFHVADRVIALSQLVNFTGWGTNAVLALTDMPYYAPGVSALTNPQPYFQGLHIDDGQGHTQIGARYALGSDLLLQAGSATASNPILNSPALDFQGHFWNGSVDSGDDWRISSVLGSGTNPQSTLLIGHSGPSTGPSELHFSFGGAIVQDGNLQLSPAASGTGVSGPQLNLCGYSQTSQLNCWHAFLDESQSDTRLTLAHDGATGVMNVAGQLQAGSLVIGGDSPMSSAPRMVFSAFLPGSLASGTWTAATWTIDHPITVTRMEAQAKVGPAVCTTNAVITLSDSSSGSLSLTLASTYSDTGAISTSFAAGSRLNLSVASAAAGCVTNPQDVNVVLQYKMQ